MDTAKLFTNGRSQAVRLPREYRFEGTEVYIKKVGNAVVLLPLGEFWQPLVESLGMFTDDFMDRRDQGENPEREDLFP